jgi:hypothetical protein
VFGACVSSNGLSIAPILWSREVEWSAQTGEYSLDVKGLIARRVVCHRLEDKEEIFPGEIEEGYGIGEVIHYMPVGKVPDFFDNRTQSIGVVQQ